MEEDVEEADVEMDMGEAPPTGVLAPEQALVPPVTMLVMASIWVSGPSGQVAKLGISSRARGKVPTTQAEQPPLAETDEELAHWLQAEK